jgi:hypothetical protein
MKVGVVGLILGLAVLLSPLFSQEKSREKMDKDVMVVKAANIKWEKAEGMPDGVWVSHLTGDTNAAPFVDMLKLARGTRIPLHWHSANHIVTVVSGSIAFGKEGKPDEGVGMEIGPGGFARISAKQPHWTFAKEDSIVVVSGDKANDMNWMDKDKEEKRK